LPIPTSASFAVLSAGLLIATIVDLRTRRIPNVLTGTMAAAGLGLAVFGWSGLSMTGVVLGCAIGLALMLPGHLLGATGAGDVKLMAAIGTLVGPLLVVKAVLFTAIAGGALAVVVAVQRQRLRVALAGTGRMMAAPGDMKQAVAAKTQASRFAYGPAIALGSLVAVLSSWF
jgi:prepilin peptidase CpaA